MSDYPKIYGFCDAGCRRRTVHYDEFANSASLIVQSRSGFVYSFEVGKAYKIKNAKASAAKGWGFNITVSTSWKISSGTLATGFFTVTLPTFDKYSDGVRFALLDIQGVYNEKTCFFSIVYEINGTRYTETFSDGNYTANTAPTEKVEYSAVATCTTDEAEDLICYRYNDDAKIFLETDTSDANATANQMLSGATAYVGGKKVSGNIEIYNDEQMVEVFAEVVQTEGNSTVDVMSQAATTLLLKEKTDGVKDGITRNAKEIANLKAGLPDEDFHEDSTVAHIKDVPANALPYAEVVEVGGMTYRINVGTEEAPAYELRSAPVTEVESVGVDLFGGEALADKIVEYYKGTKNATDKSVSFYAGNVDATKSLYAQFKADTQYTFMISVSNKDAARSNLAIFYTDGSYSPLVVSGVGTKEYVVRVSDSGKTVKSFGGNNNNGTTLLDYEKCGIFEGVLTAEDFKPYTRHTLPIPTEVQALDGYRDGVNVSVYNCIDYEKKQFVKRVGCVDMGTLGWEHRVSGERQIFYTRAIPNIALCKYADIPINAICKLYNAVAKDSVWVDGVISYFSIGSNRVDVVDNSYTDAASFKAAMSGVMLCYELAEPIITDISDILPADNLIPVEGGGTVRMVNEHGYDVPSTVVYQLENEVSA